MAVPQLKREEQQLNIESVTWGDLTWINIERPTRREIDYLAQHYPFHPFDLDDCLSRIQRPKIDEYGDYLFLILHLQVYNKETRVSSYTQLSTFIGQKYLITLHTGELKALAKLFRQCQADEALREENFHLGSGYLLYRIIDRLVDSYFPILDKILRLMEDVEDKVFDENIEAIQELSILRRDIITQRRIIWPLRTVIGGLEKKLQRFTTADLSVHYGDLMDHVNKITETLDECKEMIEVFMDTDYTLSTERLNRIARTLTVLGTILLPFLLISSMFGMNVILPGGLESGSLKPFIFLLIAMSGIAIIMLLIFHRRRWI